MRKPVVYSALFILVLAACGKDKFNTKPTLDLKSIEPTQVDLDQNVTIRMEYTDKEGDISDSVFVSRIRTNQHTTAETNGEMRFKVPDFTEKSKGELRLNLQYQFHLKAAITAPNQVGQPYDKEPDSLIFRIVLRDKAGNPSDTLITPQVVVFRQD